MDWYHAVYAWGQRGNTGHSDVNMASALRMVHNSACPPVRAVGGIVGIRAASRSVGAFSQLAQIVHEHSARLL